jgi:uncharacterized protein YjiS (DUF1127 family)
MAWGIRANSTADRIAAPATAKPDIGLTFRWFGVVLRWLVRRCRRRTVLTDLDEHLLLDIGVPWIAAERRPVRVDPLTGQITSRR